MKELMRRVVQCHLQRAGARVINRDDIDSALDEMLLKGGSLNLKRLGASRSVSSEVKPNAAS
ncbi:hypothetical protein [Roseiconus lacunae]|uniref:Uncharacterized protein n=1 Tax=Roseiconus lacunae TaxID=2605694 RepID=A0ABT7PS83_9BACT|nr:hypothetical protein [Roseiconus lacunae]MDM4019364.1 hypothetical protein [Roseiconus lacunae]